MVQLILNLTQLKLGALTELLDKHFNLLANYLQVL